MEQEWQEFLCVDSQCGSTSKFSNEEATHVIGIRSSRFDGTQTTLRRLPSVRVFEKVYRFRKHLKEAMNAK